VPRSIGSVTYDAPPNIALVKYWGLRDRALVLPYNSSISMTLDRLRSRTTVGFDPDLADDVIELNGTPAASGPREAVARFLDRVRATAGLAARARVRSRNNFPTASGLASSASGFAALAGAASAAAGLRLGPAELSRLARFGSGSACRSVYGGFVEWRAGRRPDGRDSGAVPLAPADHWPSLRDLVALVRGAPEKALRSQDAMERSVRTSPAYGRRLAGLPRRLLGIRRAIRRRDARALFPLVMEECDSFREVCETTEPPLDYLTPTSREILSLVRSINARAGRPVAAYTHDAGAHVHLFVEAHDAPRVRRAIAGVDGVEEVRTLRPGPGARRVAAGVVGRSR
jgi:diphosphomevalonate decarboxylase